MNDSDDHARADEPASPSGSTLRHSDFVARMRTITRLHQVRRLPFARFLNAYRGTVLTIEGGIGIGKSTLCRTIVKLLNEAGVQAEYLPEDYDPALLGKFLERAKEIEKSKVDVVSMEKHTIKTKANVDASRINEHAATFQFDVQERRKKTYEKALVLQRKGVAAIVDRSLVGDYAFALMQYEAGNLTDAQWEVYCTRAEKADLLDPDLTLYLQCRPDIALDRCNRRARSGEDVYSLSYFHDLSRAYMTCFRAVEYPCLYVDWTIAREIDAEGLLDRSVALDVLAHGYTQLAPPPILLPHRLQSTDQHLTSYQQYGYSADRTEVEHVLVPSHKLPRGCGKTIRLSLYDPIVGDMEDFHVTRVLDPEKDMCDE